MNLNKYFQEKYAMNWLGWLIVAASPFAIWYGATSADYKFGPSETCSRLIDDSVKVMDAIEFCSNLSSLNRAQLRDAVSNVIQGINKYCEQEEFIFFPEHEQERSKSPASSKEGTGRAFCTEVFEQLPRKCRDAGIVTYCGPEDLESWKQ